MSVRYQRLLAEWRAAAAQTREAQTRLKDRLDEFLAGRGPEPSENEVKEVHKLREAENGRLEAAMRYLRETTAPKSGHKGEPKSAGNGGDKGKSTSHVN